MYLQIQQQRSINPRPPPKFSETLRNLWNVRIELSRLGSEVPNLLMVAQKAERKLGKHSQVPRWKIGHVSELTLVRHHSGELPTVRVWEIQSSSREELFFQPKILNLARPSWRQNLVWPQL